MKPTFLTLYLLMVFITKSFCQKDSTAIEGAFGKNEWVYVGESDNNTEKWYVKSDYVFSDFTGIEIWVKHTTLKNTIKGVVYKNTISKELDLIDCMYKRLKFIQGIIYSATGKIIESDEPDSDEIKWHEVVPDSIGESIVKKVCELFNK